MNIHINKLVSNRVAASIFLGAVTLSTGFAVFKLTRKKKASKNSSSKEAQMTIFELIDEDREDEDSFYTAQEQSLPEVILEEKPYIEHVNVFHTRDKWDYEMELSTRTPDSPYIIHADEYISDEMDFRQETVTYYVGDDIMADLHDVPIYNYQSLMGELRWGHGSGDNNVVYIRNEKTKQEWEVLKHLGRFELEVL